MRDGDLSNEVVPRILLVWEECIGYIPSDEAQAKLDKFLLRAKWPAAVECYEPNLQMIDKMWDVTFRLNLTLDVLTYYPADISSPLTEWLSDYDVPFGAVHCEDPQKMARKIAYMPDVAAVYDPQKMRSMAFGSKGRHITSIHQLGEL